jgi:hypothetical protein
MESPAASPEAIFGAVLRKRRPRWRLWALAAALTAIALAPLVARARHGFRVMTPQGFRVLAKGMTAQDVRGLLGAPIAAERDAEGNDCLIYGRPTEKAAQFTGYAACYKDGVLQRVSQREFSVQAIDPEVLRKLP